jgi:outer membrane protein insertion porin family
VHSRNCFPLPENNTSVNRTAFRFILQLILTIQLLSLPSQLWANLALGTEKKLFEVKGLEVRGNKKVEAEAVLEKVSTKPGTMATNYSLRKDIERIYALKHFENVEVHREGNNLVFMVKEKPLISKIVFEGNDEINNDDLLAVIKSKEYAIMDINVVKADIDALTKHYEDKGFFLANIRYEFKKLTEENLELIFKIKEFDKVRVKKVIFLGNKAFSDFQLKDIMETREEGLFSFMSGAGNYKELNFQTDVERIKYFYKTKGYLQVNIGTPEITVSEDKKWVFISMKLTEGPIFSVNQVKFQGEVLFPEEELLSKLKMKEGDTYSEETLRQDIQMLTELYQDQGYAFANVLRTLDIVPGANKVDIEFSFEKGKIAYFGKIDVKGNTKTRDKVVRRELKIREGARYSGTDLRVSKENVNRLGFFEQGSVIFNTVSAPGKDDVLDVEIQVKERNTGQISLGAGYSTATGGFMQASIAQNNFMGYGQNLSFSLSLSKVNQTWNIGFMEPYLFDTKWTAGADIFSQNNRTSSSVEYKRNGFDTRIGHPIFDYTRLFLSYRLEDTELKAINDPTIDPNVENGLASSVRVSLVRDLRDNTFEPTKGYYANLAVEYAGVGGDKKWLKTIADGRYFWNFYSDFVFRSRVYGSKLDIVDSRPIPRTEKFTLGGARDLRGYNLEAIGPRSTVVDALGRTISFNSGALFAAYTSLEVEHPLAREAGLKWVVFFDAGDAGDYENFRPKMDYGFGFRWFSPIGVLRFEFGYPINPTARDAGSQFHFDIGQLF